MNSISVGPHHRARRAFLCATILAAAASSPALAQLAPPAPVRQTVDKNGVDLFRGTMNVDAPALTIGRQDNGLSYYKLSRGGNVISDNVIATLSQSGSIMTVRLGGVSDTFTVGGTSSAPTFTSTEGKGATLTLSSNIYTYRRRDGTVVLFDKNLFRETSTYSNAGRATQITDPSGARLTFAYEFISYCARPMTGADGEDYCAGETKEYRIANVRNSYGYRLNLGYGYDFTSDPNNPYTQPDFAAYAKVTAVSAENLAVASPTVRSQTFTDGSDTSGAFLDIKDPMDRVTRLRYNANGVTGIGLPGSTAEDVTITYASGRVSAVTTQAGTTTYSSTDASGVRTVSVDGPLAGPADTTIYKFSIAKERLTELTDATSRTTRAEYDASGRATRVTQPESNYVEYKYDARGNIIEQRQVGKNGPGADDIVTMANYDLTCSNAVTCNQPNWTKDAKGNQTDYTYDPVHGGVLTVTSPAPASGGTRPQIRYSYTSRRAYFKDTSGSIVASGEPVFKLTGTSSCQTGDEDSATAAASCIGTADEVKATVSYGPQTTGVGNNLLPVSASRGNGAGTLTATSAVTYDDVGNLLTVDGPLAGTADTTRNWYNANREQVGVVGPDPDGTGAPLKNRAQRITIDERGLSTKVEIGTTAGQTAADWDAFVPLQTRETVYDARRRPTLQRVLGGTSRQLQTQTSYDAADRLQCTAVRMDRAQFTASASLGACTPGANTGPADRITRLAYDAAGRHAKTLVAYGVIEDEAYEVQKAYSLNGQLRYLFDGNENRTTYIYDVHDRLSQTRYPPADNSTAGAPSSTTDYEELGYDANSNVISRRMRDGTVNTFSYDNLNRMRGKALPVGADVSLAYDNLNRLTSATQSGIALSFTYDALGRNRAQVGPHGTTASEWDLAGKRTKLTYPGSGLNVVYDYLTTGEMRHIRENGVTSGVGVLANFGYDDLGNRTSLSRGNGTVTTYTHDVISRSNSINQDVAGTANDLLIRNMVYNPASQIVSLNRTNDAYAWTGAVNAAVSSPANGLNQLTSVGGTAATYDANGNLTTDPVTGRSYIYFSDNMLRSVTGGGLPTVSLLYDPLSRLAQTATSTVTSQFAYDGLEAIAEYDGAGALQRRYVFGPGVDEPLVEYTGSGTASRKWLHADERGSIIAVSDGSGNVTQANRYDEYGQPQSTNTGRFQYTGQMWLPEAGAYHYKARAYMPQLGRFLQPDPIRYKGGMNLYAYVRNDPVNLTDPLGLCDGCEIIVTGLRRVHFEYTAGGAIAWPAGRGDNFRGDGGSAGGGGAENLPAEEEAQRCTSAPFDDLLADQGVRDQMNNAIRQSLSTPNLGFGDDKPAYGSEVAFNVLDFGSGLYYVGATYTSHMAHSVRYRRSALSFLAISLTAIHTHQSPLGLPGLSAGDVSTAKAQDVNVIAVEPSGETYCFAP